MENENEWGKQYFQQISENLKQNPYDWETLQKLAIYHSEHKNFDQGITYWESSVRILGERFGTNRKYGNPKKFAWAYIFKARDLLEKLEIKLKTNKDFDKYATKYSSEINSIKELYDKAAKLYAIAYENKGEMKWNTNTMILKNNIPQYRIIIEDLDYLESLPDHILERMIVKNYLKTQTIIPRGRNYVKSSNIQSIGYDSSSRILEIEFCSNSIYHYFQVPENVYDGFIDATSKGQYLNEKIKNKYKFERKL